MKVCNCGQRGARQVLRHSTVGTSCAKSISVGNSSSDSDKILPYEYNVAAAMLLGDSVRCAIVHFVKCNDFNDWVLH